MSAEFTKEAADAAEVCHLFHGKGYIKVMQLAPGQLARSHKHNLAHNSMLLQGSVKVTVNGLTFAFTAPSTIHIEAETVHEIEALDHVVWACIWGNPEGLETQEAFEASVIADATVL